jgi:hypothetical protein
VKTHVCVILGLIGWGLVPRAAHASLILKSDTFTTGSSPTSTTPGVFNLTLQVVQPDSSNPLAGYQVVLNLVPVGNAQGLSFVTPYVQNPPNPIFPSAPPINFGSTAIEIQAGNNLPFGATPVPITNGVGLIQVDYQLAPNAAGVFDINIDSSQTLLVDNNSNTIPYTPLNGVITVTTPEPSSACILMALGALPLLKRRRRLIA